ncbi:MAG: MHYT domain-containing protein [Gemmatimonas sp.]
MIRVIGCIVDQHDYRLVALSVLICLFASYTALSLFARAQNTPPPWRLLWVAGTAVVAGIGVWSTHFVAMLAFLPGLPSGYDAALTMASITAAILIGGIAFLVSLRLNRIVGGAAFGLAIAAMHYLGMEAFETAATRQWDERYVAASVVLGVALSIAAMALADRLHTVVRRLGAATLLAAAIGGLHFTAMAALSLDPDPTIVVSDALVAKEWIAVATASVMMLVIGLSFAGAILDQHLADRNAAEADRLRHHVAELEATKRELEQRTSEVSRALDAAAAASQAKSQFLATMSHELRTPLNAILGFSELLDQEMFGPLGDSRYHEYVRSILASGHHLLGLINDVLDFSKLEAGRFELQEDVIEIGRAVVEAVTMIQPQARKNGVEVVTAIRDALPPVRIDERRMRQVLLNLLSNAVKFTPAAGRVTVAAACDDDGIVVSVSDTGIGMAEQDIPKALDRFGQIDSSLNRRYDGTGLGLPLSKRLVELHGGTLEIASALGSGTTVTVRLPRERIAGVTPAEPPASAATLPAAPPSRTASA